jgi:hypothetical protein
LARLTTLKRKKSREKQYTRGIKQILMPNMFFELAVTDTRPPKDKACRQAHCKIHGEQRSGCKLKAIYLKLASFSTILRRSRPFGKSFQRGSPPDRTFIKQFDSVVRAGLTAIR